jgi:hypothetical protein
MQQVRFFEDREGEPDVNDGRRLLLGIMTTEGPADGGTREAVRVATQADVETYAAAYALYFEAAEESEGGAGVALGGDQQPVAGAQPAPIAAAPPPPATAQPKPA